MPPFTLSIDRTLEERKVDLIFNLYINPADQDYLTARWAYGHGMFQSFYSLAGQSVEKYLKAALLLQDKSTIDYQHDLKALYKTVKNIDPHRCLPEMINLPKTTAMGRDAWQGKRLFSFIEYLREYGSPDNRYAFYGTFVNGPIIHILDILCHALRRLMRCTNFVSGDIFELRDLRFIRDYRIPDPQDWMLGSNETLERLFSNRYNVGENEQLRKTFLVMNIAFSDERNEGDSIFGGQHIHLSPIYNVLVRQRELDPSPENQAVIDQLRQWAREKVQMTRAIRTQLGYRD